VRRVPFSCFARPDSFSAVPRASSPVFMFCAPGLIFDSTDGVRSHFHFLRARTRFRRYRGRRVSFSCCALPDWFSTVLRASGPIFKFCAPGLISAVPKASGPFFMFCSPGLVFGGAEFVLSRFHVLLARTHFRRFRGHQVPFSCFARPDSFWAVPRASGPVFMFCAPGLVFGGSEGVGSRFHVLRSRSRFRRFRGIRVPFSCFTRSDSFSAVPRASGPVLMFSAPGLVFSGTEGVASHFHVLLSQTRFGGAECIGSRFHVLRAPTHFGRYREHWVPFSCFALPDSFWAVLRASGPVFMFCAP
jgi:hypothetical protein